MSKILEAPLSLKADVWTHFGFKAKEGNQGIDKTNAICKHCQASIRYTGNTTNLRSHLQRHHADKLASPQPKKTRDPTQTTLDNTASKLPSNSVRAQKITESVVHYICKGLCPYSVVENTGFRFMINTLDPRYVIPTRSYMTDKAVPRIYDKVKDDVKSALSSAPQVALTCDGWTSRATEAFVTITCHYVDEEWELMSHVLQTRAMHETHTGSNIAELLKAALEEWDLVSKDPAIVTDNAANMSVAAELAGMLHFRCFAHTLNLASQRALKLPAVARLLGRVRQISTFFKRSITASHVLRQKQKLLELPEHELITDVVTRWNSAHDMLERFLEQQPAVSASLLSNELRKTEKEVCTLCESDITSAEEIVDAMKPMKIATLVMSKESSPTLSVVAPLHAQLIQDFQESRADSEIVKEIKAAICQDLSKRYMDQQKETMYVCSALNPRFKALPFLPDDEREEIYLRITAEARRIQELFQEEAKVIPGEEDNHVEDKDDIPASPPPKKKKDLCCLADLLGSTYSAGPAVRHRTTQAQAEEEMSSSPVLAERDAKEWLGFYNELNITVDANINKSESELKKCYECKVVYGTTVSFAADWLRQRFLRQDIRSKREFQCVIVDEVDSLMLDKGLEVVYLSTEIPLMECLNGILAEIWLIINQLKRLETGEILGPVQLFSELLSEIITENKKIDQDSIVQMAVEAGIMPTKYLKQTQENMTNALKQLDNASVVQIVAFLTIFAKKIT
ncbi:zinc finger BED domain-containing 1-like protein [Labeo rohita]|uniref:Zinc finger BED domain-containing 1-like protein n=1 Tax=Labeo rohita TaxID=84645 RepID=A0A498MLM7_LABRO|nr:zinc finger BED domain-containing 1-like protein [Labeo rohita]